MTDMDWTKMARMGWGGNIPLCHCDRPRSDISKKYYRTVGKFKKVKSVCYVIFVLTFCLSTWVIFANLNCDNKGQSTAASEK